MSHNQLPEEQNSIFTLFRRNEEKTISLYPGELGRENSRVTIDGEKLNLGKGKRMVLSGFEGDRVKIQIRPEKHTETITNETLLPYSIRCKIQGGSINGDFTSLEMRKVPHNQVEIIIHKQHEYKTYKKHTQIPLVLSITVNNIHTFSMILTPRSKHYESRLKKNVISSLTSHLLYHPDTDGEERSFQVVSSDIVYEEEKTILLTPKDIETSFTIDDSIEKPNNDNDDIFHFQRNISSTPTTNVLHGVDDLSFGGISDLSTISRCINSENIKMDKDSFVCLPPLKKTITKKVNPSNLNPLSSVDYDLKYLKKFTFFS